MSAVFLGYNQTGYFSNLLLRCFVFRTEKESAKREWHAIDWWRSAAVQWKVKNERRSPFSPSRLPLRASRERRLGTGQPFLSFKNPRFGNEAKCKIFHVKTNFIWIRKTNQFHTLKTLHLPFAPPNKRLLTSATMQSYTSLVFNKSLSILATLLLLRRSLLLC